MSDWKARHELAAIAHFRRTEVVDRDTPPVGYVSARLVGGNLSGEVHGAIRTIALGQGSELVPPGLKLSVRVDVHVDPSADL